MAANENGEYEYVQSHSSAIVDSRQLPTDSLQEEKELECFAPKVGQ